MGIGGFIIAGNTPKRVIIRGIGPSLSHLGVPNVLYDPVLELRGPETFNPIINNNWRDDQEQEIRDTGIPPSNDLEAAIVVTLGPGAYTAIMRGNSPSPSGVGLIEIYDLNQGVDAKLANLSTRGFVQTADNIVIAGFLISNNGLGKDRIVVRGIGPSLAPGSFPPSDVLGNPTVGLRNSNGTLLIANNDWRENPEQAAEIEAAGLAPANNLESALIGPLSPGLYTALLSGLNNGTGIGVVEVYDLGAIP